MPSEKYLDTSGLAEWISFFDEIPEISLPIAERMIKKSLNSILGRVKPYPPATEANKPGRTKVVQHTLKDGTVKTKVIPMGYYERHRGWWYPIMRKSNIGTQTGKARGVIRAKASQVAGAPEVAGYKLASGGTSEFLGQSWTIETHRMDFGVEGELGNNASYAEYVEGPADVQARHMDELGWPNLDEAIEQSEIDIDAAGLEALEEVMKRLGF